MAIYCDVDGESALDPAADFVDTFYSYKDPRYEINVEALNGEEDSFIIDLYGHSRPLSPFTPEPNKDSSPRESSSDLDIANIEMQQEAKTNMDIAGATLDDQKRCGGKPDEFQAVEETIVNLHNVPQKHSPKEVAYVQN